MRPAKWRALDPSVSSLSNGNDSHRSSKDLLSQSSAVFACPNNTSSQHQNVLDGEEEVTSHLENFKEEIRGGKVEPECQMSFSSPHLLHLHLFEEHSDLAKEQRRKGLPTYACVAESCSHIFQDKKSRLDHLASLGKDKEEPKTQVTSTSPTLSSHSDPQLMQMLSELDGVKYLETAGKYTKKEKTALRKRGRPALSESDSEIRHDSDALTSLKGNRGDGKVLETMEIGDVVEGQEEDHLERNLVESLNSLSLIPPSLRLRSRRR